MMLITVKKQKEDRAQAQSSSRYRRKLTVLKMQRLFNYYWGTAPADEEYSASDGSVDEHEEIESDAEEAHELRVESAVDLSGIDQVSRDEAPVDCNAQTEGAEHADGSVNEADTTQDSEDTAGAPAIKAAVEANNPSSDAEVEISEQSSADDVKSGTTATVPKPSDATDLVQSETPNLVVDADNSVQNPSHKTIVDQIASNEVGKQVNFVADQTNPEMTDQVFEQITDDLITPQTTIHTTSTTKEEEGLSLSNEEIVREDDAYPRAQEFLAEISVVDDEEQTIPPEQAAQIIGFDDDDTRTVFTTRTSATTVSRRVPTQSSVSAAAAAAAEEGKKHEHQSLFDILDRNFEDLGDAGVGYKDVKLCFVAFVVVFAPSVAVDQGVSEVATAAATCDDVLAGEAVGDDHDGNEVLEESEEHHTKPLPLDLEGETPKTVPRPNVPLSVAFALWRKVLRLSPGNDTTTLSYVRSTLVLLGLLELSTIEREDAPIPTATSNRRNPPKPSCIECLHLHHDINQQYGEYLAYGDHIDSFKSCIDLHERKWNDAVMDEALAIGSNEYTIRMQPLNTMRAYHVQDAFDLLQDKSFVRRRVRLLGSSEAALAHIRDIDELLRLIDKRMLSNDPTAEPVDEQDGVLSAFDQLKKYYVHMVHELTKYNTQPEEGTEVNTSLAASLDKTTLSKIRDLGKALHLIGASLGGYGFFDQEMEYYNEALRLKELCARGKLDYVSISDTLHCMGFSLDNAGKSEEALEFYDRALDIRYEYLGDDDLRVAETLHNKGALLCDEETSEEAMECLEEALRIRELHYGEEHESCADTMQWMGNLLRQYGDASDALDYFKFALRIKQIRLGADHIDVANTLFNTAVLLDDVEKYDLSLIAYKEAYRIRKLVLGEKNQDVADTLFCLGNVATVTEKHGEALEYFNESIKILEELIKDEDMYSGTIDDSLLFLFEPHSMKPGLQTQYQKLNQCLEEVLPLTKLLVGSNHGDVCKLLNRMGDVYKRLHDWDNAIGSFQGALRVKRSGEDAGSDDIEVATLLQKKGEVHLYKSDFSRAKSTFDACLQIRERLLGRDSNAYTSSLYCLGVAYHCLKDYSHSQILFQECIRIQTNLPEKYTQRIVQSLCWLGRNYQSLNAPNKALEKYLLALKHSKINKNAADYRVVVMLLHTIGETYENESIKQPDMALKCYTEEIHLIDTKLDVEDMEVARLAALAHYKAGLLCQAKEDLHDSIEHLEQGLNFIKRMEDENQASTEAMIADTLGVLHASKEDYNTAKQYFSDSYSLYEKALGRDNKTTSDCAFRLAECLEQVGSKLALDFFMESLRVHRLHISDDDERVGALLFSIGRVHFRNNAYVDAATSFDEALKTRRRLFGDCTVVAETYHQLANSYVQLQQSEKALIFYKESSRILKKLGCEKNTLYKVSLDMANCCDTIENYQLAIESYNDCLQMTEGLDDNKNIALVLQRMGEIQMNKLHNYDDATKLFLDALELLQAENCAELSDEDESSALGLMFQIGQVHALAGEYEKALDFYEEHIKLAESLEPVQEELVGNSLLEMGAILADMGDNSDYELAIEKLKECLDIRRKIQGSDNELVADVLHKLAAVHEKDEDYDEAVKCLSEALRTYKMTHQIAKVSNTYHTLARMKANVAEASGSDADRKAAIECYESAIDTRRQDPTLDDLELASMLYEYATLLCLDNSYAKAMPLLEEALRIQKSKKGLRDGRVANIILRMAECHVHEIKFDSSLVCLEQVSFIQDSLESCDIDIVLLNHLLGITYLERGDCEKAISTSLAALKMMKMEMNQDSLECADIHTNLGKAYGAINEYDKAIESLVEALRIQKVELGNDSIEYADTVLHLAEIHVATNKHAQAINCLDECTRVFESSPDERGSLADALEMKADCHFVLENYSAAASAFQECINIIESLDSETNTKRLASLMHRLGKSYRTDYDNAFSSYRESIKLYNEALGAENIHVANVMYDAGTLTLNDGDNEKALQCFKEVIRIYTLKDQRQHTKVADSLVQIGTIQADDSDYEESMESVKNAIRIYKEELGIDAVEIGKALLLCGRLNDVSGDYDKMKSNFEESLRIFKASLGERDMNVSIALSNLGVAHSRRQEFPEAIEMCKEALRIRKLHTSNDRDVADSLFNIGNLYDEWGEHQDAVPYLKGSLKLYRSLLGDEDISIAHCQSRLGTIYWNSGDVDDAIDSFSDALYVCEEVDEDVEHLLMSIYKGLGDCYFSQGDLELALESFASCLKMQKLELGDDCVEMAETCDSIGRVYQESGKHNEAMQFYQKALQIHEHNSGQTSAQCLTAHMNISKAFAVDEKYDDAIEHLRKCIELFSAEDSNQPQPEEASMIYHQLGIALNRIGNHEEAIEVLNKAIDIRTKVYGNMNLQVAEIMLDLGAALKEQDPDEALTVYDDAITILQGLPECNKGKTAAAYSQMADILSSQCKYETSLSTLKRTLKLYSEVYGSDSMSVAKTLVHLGHVYSKVENIDRACSCFSEGIKIFRSNSNKRNDDDDVVMSQAMKELAKIYARMNMHDKAIELCTDSLRILKQYPSKESDGSVADTCLTIAEILNEWDKVEQSARFYEEALRYYQEKFGLESSEVATCYYGIALTQKKLNDPQTALRSFGKALRIHRTEGDKTLFVANDLFQIGQIYDAYDETSKALQCFQECLKIRQANLSEDDLDLLAAKRYVDSLRRKMEY